jgi:hypothetical protein
MNREGAETYLRLLGDAKMRGELAWWEGVARARVMVVGEALTAVGALDAQAVEDILADLDLAASVRQLHRQPGQGTGRGPARPVPGPLSAGTVPGPPLPAGTIRAAAAARWAAQVQLRGPGPRTPGSLAKAWAIAGAGSAEPAEPANPEPPGAGGAGRFVPVGLAVPFYDEGISGELFLMSYAQTGSGGRFIALWGINGRSLEFGAGLPYPGLILADLLTVTDDRGTRYDLDFRGGGGVEHVGEIGLRPVPADDIRWLDVATPLRPPTRIDLDPKAPAAGDEAEVSEATLSPGEHLLMLLADRLLTLAPEIQREMWRPAAPLGPQQAMTAGLGDIIVALEAAEVLPPLSPVPAWLAALCASLRIGGPEHTVPPAKDLPERWLSLLAHYQRRKPEVAPVGEGYAAATAALPELDGIRLALLGLHNSEGNSSLHVLTQGRTPQSHPGLLGIHWDFPLSIWVKDSGGRWHVGRLSGWHRGGCEGPVRLRLVPPLTRSTAWVEVLAAGQSAEVRTRLPLRWGCPR